jgi:hypothetical protein
MLDPGKRKCHSCYQDQERYGIPIPNCLNPDGDGKACQYPEVSRSLMEENIRAWDLWAGNAEQIIRVDVSMAGAMFTLNLESLRCLMEMMGIEDQVGTYRKIRVIFNEWHRINHPKESETEKSMKRVKAARKHVG